MAKTALDKVVRYRLTVLGMSMTEFAERLGIARQNAYKRLESSTPSNNSIKSIADALEMTVEDLLELIAAARWNYNE